MLPNTLAHQLHNSLTSLRAVWRVGLLLALLSFWVLNSSYHDAWMAFTSNEGLPMVAPFQQWIGAVALLSMGWRWLHMRQTVSS